MKVIHCLIVDDDLDDQEIFVMTVESLNKNITCRTAINGVDALTQLKPEDQFVPDYIFLDVNMPKMNGIDCLRNISQLGHLKTSKIFMYSTTAETQVVQTVKALGALDFIVKPASTLVLKEKLSEIFAN